MYGVSVRPLHQTISATAPSAAIKWTGRSERVSMRSISRGLDRVRRKDSGCGRSLRRGRRIRTAAPTTAATAGFVNRVWIGTRVRAGSGNGLGRRRGVGAVDLVGARIADVSTVGGFDVFGIRLN